MYTLPRVILITGTPGVGKTSVSHSLMEKHFSVISLNDFIISNGIYYGYDFTRDSVIIDDEYLEIIIKDSIKNLQDTVFIEGHTTELLPQDIVTDIIVLRCNPSVLRKRLSSRDYSSEKIAENIHAEIMEECKISMINKYPDMKIIEIDSTSLSIEDITNTIISKLFK